MRKWQFGVGRVLKSIDSVMKNVIWCGRVYISNQWQQRGTDEGSTLQCPGEALCAPNEAEPPHSKQTFACHAPLTDARVRDV